MGNEFRRGKLSAETHLALARADAKAKEDVEGFNRALEFESLKAENNRPWGQVNLVQSIHASG